METLITICARSGSQGVKNKNIRPLLGKPLISHTIGCALEWGKADRVIVSTDSENIARIALDYGADVPFLRPNHLAKGDVPKMAVVRHVLSQIERDNKKQYEAIIDLDVTAPLRHVSDIEGAYRLFTERRPLTVFSVVNARKNPYYNIVEEGPQGFLRVSKEFGKAVTCRQNAPVVYDMNASIHVYSRDYLLDVNNWHVCSNQSLPYVMEDLSAVDIDREIDLLYVQFLLKEGLFVP